MNLLVVRNVAQKALFEEELQGQLSDGYWENTKPHDHWEPWCRCTVLVDENVGRNFDWYKGKRYDRRTGRDYPVSRPLKSNYNFANSMLLEAVGDRMLEIARKATGSQSYSMTDLRRDLKDLNKIIKLYKPSLSATDIILKSG